MVGIVVLVGVAIGVVVAEAVSIALPARPRVPEGVLERGSALTWRDEAGQRWRLDVPQHRGWQFVVATQLTRGLVPVPWPRRVPVSRPVLVGPRLDVTPPEQAEPNQDEDEIVAWAPGLPLRRPIWRATAKAGRLVVAVPGRASAERTDAGAVIATLHGPDPDALADEAMGAVLARLANGQEVELVTWAPDRRVTVVGRGGIEDAKWALAEAVEAPGD